GLEVVEGADELVKAALDKGLLINAVTDTTLRFLPPLIIDKEDVDQAVATLEELIVERD
ncbi:MAG: aminotransferase class III-fold pyridoxal phosphate-dependent enzyme, partial [Bacillota bacterium]